MATSSDTPATLRPEAAKSWYAVDVASVVAAMGSDAASGLSRSESASRLTRFGPNEIAREKPPSLWAVAGGQLRDRASIRPRSRHASVVGRGPGRRWRCVGLLRRHLPFFCRSL